MNENPPGAASRTEARLRLAGMVILVLGLTAAGIVYWLGTRSAALADDPSMLGFNQSEKRQMAMLYGKQGALIEDLANGLKQPGTQAFLIAGGSVILAVGCFYFARPPHHDVDPGIET